MKGKKQRYDKKKIIKGAKRQKIFAERYKSCLENFVNLDKTKDKTLEDLIDEKSNELNYSEKIEEQNYATILSLSLYFIKNNDFIEDIFFEQIDEAIYKIFYNFFMNPNEENHNLFLNSFEYLNYGYGNIYLICKKLTFFTKLTRDNSVDIFFKIILSEYFPSLQAHFHFPIKRDQIELIKILNGFIRIRYNYDKVERKEILDLFKREIDDNHNINGNNGESSLTNLNNNISVSKTSDEDKSKEVKHSIKGNYSEQKEESDDLQKNSNIKINFSNVNEFNINRDKNKTINRNHEDKLFDYFMAIQNMYKEKNYKTPVLDYLITNKEKFRLEFFKYIKNEDSYIDHLYALLDDDLFSMNYDLIDFKENKIGYICVQDQFEKKFIEGIFSIIDQSFLFEKITSDYNFPPDDIYSPKEIIANNAFKSRALSFEYYINSEIIINQLKAKERPRVIFPFINLEKIINLEKSEERDKGNDEENTSEKNKENNKKSTKEKNEEKNKKKDNSSNSLTDSALFEVDGIILEKEFKEIELDNNFFIPDPIYKFCCWNNIEDRIENYVKGEKKSEEFVKIEKDNKIEEIEKKNQIENVGEVKKDKKGKNKKNKKKKHRKKKKNGQIIEKKEEDKKRTEDKNLEKEEIKEEKNDIEEEKDEQKENMEKNLKEKNEEIQALKKEKDKMKEKFGEKDEKNDENVQEMEIKEEVGNIKEEDKNESNKQNEKNNKFKFYLEKNCLCVIEIKNQFPPNRNEDKNMKDEEKSKKKSPVDFRNMVKSLVKKSLLFKDMFEQLNEKIESIRLILLYDAVHKKNYLRELDNAMNDLFTKKDEGLLEIIEFQCIYIKPSYLAGQFYNSKKEINKLNKEIIGLNEEISGLNGEILGLKNNISSMEINNKKERERISKLEDFVKTLQEEIKLLKRQKPENQNQKEKSDEEKTDIQVKGKPREKIEKESDNNSIQPNNSNLEKNNDDNKSSKKDMNDSNSNK